MPSPEDIEAGEAFERFLDTDKGKELWSQVRDLMKQAHTETETYLACWEQKFGVPFPKTIADLQRLAARAGFDPNWLRDGEYSPADVFPIIEGYLLRMRDARANPEDDESGYITYETTFHVEWSREEIDEYLAGRRSLLYDPPPANETEQATPKAGRDRMFYEWNQEGIGPAEIRDRWNALPEAERKAICPRGWHPIPDGETGRNRIKSALTRAKNREKS